MNEDLTIRDKMAIGALTAVAQGSWNGALCRFLADDKRVDIAERIAKSAYMIADAMLEERSKK